MDPFDAYATAHNLAAGMTPEQAATVTANTYGDQTMTTETTTCEFGQTYTIRTRATGRNFGAVAEVLSADGTAIYTTDTYPHDNPRAAADDAKAWLANRWK